MTQEVLATEISLAKDEILVESQVQELVRTGRKRRVKNMVVAEPLPEIPPVAEVAPAESEVAEEETSNPVVSIIAPLEPEAPKEPWADFDPSLRRLVGHFQGLRESHVLDRAMRDLIGMAESAQRVEDFASFSDSQLANFVDTIRNRLPQIERDMVNFMQTISMVRALPTNVDFI